jgi:hypothetical protein
VPGCGKGAKDVGLILFMPEQLERRARRRLNILSFEQRVIAFAAPSEFAGKTERAGARRRSKGFAG